MQNSSHLTPSPSLIQWESRLLVQPDQESILGQERAPSLEKRAHTSVGYGTAERPCSRSGILRPRISVATNPRPLAETVDSAAARLHDSAAL